MAVAAGPPSDATDHDIFAPAPPSCNWFPRLTSALDPRTGPRLAWLLVGAILARGRRTVTSGIRAAGLSGEYRPCYTTVAAAGIRAALRPDMTEPEIAAAAERLLALAA